MKRILQKNTIEEEKLIWQDALFVFDSSALLNFYEYSEGARKVLYTKIFRLLKNRLWITNQTEYEYLKNKEKVLFKPKKLYDDLATTYFDSKQIQSIKNQFSQLQNRTKKQDKHPHISEKIFKKFETQLEEFEKRFMDFSQELAKQIEIKKNEIETLKDKDTVHAAILKHFKVTSGYNFEKLIDVVKEGEFRYRNTIPPGYEDLKEKIGLQIYGDLIIWKQILDLAFETRKPIILIIDDLKIDWCYQNSRDKNLIDSPREELIKEIQDRAGVKFLAYSSTQFLQKSKDILEISITEEIINEVNKSNQFNIVSQVESLVYNWAQNNWGHIGSVHKGGIHDQVDIIVNIDSINVGIEIKYYPSFRKQSIRSLVERLHPRFEARGYYDKYDEIQILIVCEDEEYAQQLYEQTYELPTNQIRIRIGFINQSSEFELV